MASTDNDGAIDKQRLRPKKRLSQNFLIDKNIANKIINIARIKEGESVIEVGPGRGILTRVILSYGAKLTCIEIDPALAEKLTRQYRGQARIITADVLKYSFFDICVKTQEKSKLISNLPYNISGPLLAKLIEERQALSFMVLMFQKEVAERIIARPGTKAYGALSVLAGTYLEVKSEFDIAPHLFRPIPKVMSTVVSLRVLPSPRVEVTDEILYKRVVRGAFAQRRKTLRNALSALYPNKELINTALNCAEIDPTRRAETLDMEDFSKLTRALSASGASLL